MSTRVILSGLSTRAAAVSAAKAGFEVTAFDAFADLDQHPNVDARAVTPSFTPRRAIDAAATVAGRAVAYLSNFENHPDDVEAFAAGRLLWGNGGEVLRRVRDPRLLATTLLRHGIAAPRVGTGRERSPAGSWLLKPSASGGGHGVRTWEHGRRVPNGHYLQERVRGCPASIVFVANGREAVVLGLSRQLCGLPAFGASGFQYCGNVLDPALWHDVRLMMLARHLVAVVVAEFQLVGVNGIDVVIDEGVPRPIEVNPRWSASMELVERAFGLSVFAAHAAACADRVLPRFDLASRQSTVFGKAVVYAPHDVVVGDTRGWLADTSVRDIPRAGERIRAGQPVCTVFADAPDANACVAALERRADDVRRELARWHARV